MTAHPVVRPTAASRRNKRSGCRVPRVIDLARRAKRPRRSRHHSDNGCRSDDRPHRCEEPAQGSCQPKRRRDCAAACDQAQPQCHGRDDPAADHPVAQRRDAADVKVGRAPPCPLRDIDPVERSNDGGHVLAGGPQGARSEAFRHITRGVVTVTIVHRGEVQSRNVLAREDGEVGVVWQPPVDLDRERPAARMRSRACPWCGDPAIAWSRLEEDRGAVRSRSFDVDIHLQSGSHHPIRDKCRGSHQIGFFPVSDQYERRPLPIRAGGDHSRGFEADGNAETVVCRTWRFRRRIVMREKADRFRTAAAKRRDDVRYPRRSAQLGPHRVGLLNVYVIPVELQLIDDVGTSARVRLAADRAASDCARQHRHVRPRVRF